MSRKWNAIKIMKKRCRQNAKKKRVLRAVKKSQQPVKGRIRRIKNKNFRGLVLLV